MKPIKIENTLKLDFQGKEAYKRLRSNIQFCGTGIKVVGVTSCVPSEGKSTTSVNVAASMAEMGKKVLFIDTDLRKSVLVGRYKIDETTYGLSHFLSGMNEKKDIIYHSSINHLDLILSGPVPPNPSELLGSVAFQNLISELRDEYDYIFIDTPPIGSVIDAAIISKICDGMVLVIASNNTSYHFAQKMKEQLEITGTKILGAVLNKVDLGKNSYYGRYYER